jgi:hypothetical protein
MVVPQRGFGAPAQECLGGPTRVGCDKGAIALDRGAVVLVAQDDPFRELPRDRIRYRGFGLGGVPGLVLANQLDDAFQRIGVGLLGR